MDNILFSIGHDAKKKRARNFDLTWPEFIADMMLSSMVSVPYLV